jgi:hypothetical protein
MWIWNERMMTLRMAPSLTGYPAVAMITRPTAWEEKGLF